MARNTGKPKSDAAFDNSDESLNDKALDKVSGGIIWGAIVPGPRCPKCGLQGPEAWGHSCSQTSTTTVTRS